MTEMFENSAAETFVHIPLLGLMREIYALPREPSIRFPRYLTLVKGTLSPRYPPLVLMNPMANTHLNTTIDTLITLGVEDAAVGWIAKTALALGMSDGFHHGFGVVDDVAGGWTNRADIEMSRRFAALPQRKYHWCTTTLFASDQHSLKSVKREVQATVIRRYWQILDGTPLSLRQMLAQEQLVARLTGTSDLVHSPCSSATSQNIFDALEETAYPAQISCILGDVAAQSLGYPSRGYEKNAGLAYAANSCNPLLMPLKQAILETIIL